MHLSLCHVPQVVIPFISDSAWNFIVPTYSTMSKNACSQGHFYEAVNMCIRATLARERAFARGTCIASSYAIISGSAWNFIVPTYSTMSKNACSQGHFYEAVNMCIRATLARERAFARGTCVASPYAHIITYFPNFCNKYLQNFNYWQKINTII